ncbi:MAG TPA: paraquat-inducible protein A [Nitrospirota bacterium]|nr:paraquat-inducible protein A [Nitrospirota bacterium]
MYNQPLPDASLIACPHCDLLQRLPALARGESARCPRCNDDLWRRHEDPLNTPLALTIAAVLLYVVANAVPMLGISAVGREAFTTVIGGAVHLWETGWRSVAVLVLFTAVVAPGLQIGLMLAILLGARSERPPKWVGTLLRYYPDISAWSMIEVMILGVLVALFKIADYAKVTPGLALYVLGALVFLIAAIEASFDPREVWERVEWAETAERREAGGKQMTEVTS